MLLKYIHINLAEQKFVKFELRGAPDSEGNIFTTYDKLTLVVIRKDYQIFRGNLDIQFLS